MIHYKARGDGRAETYSNESKTVDNSDIPAMEGVGISVTTTGLQRKLKARHIQVGKTYGKG